MMGMTDLVKLVKLVSYIEIGLILFLLCIYYILQAFLHFHASVINKKKEKIEALISRLIKHPTNIPAPTLAYLNRNVSVLLSCLNRVENPLTLPATLQTQLVEHVLQPQARQFANMQHWLKQYFAVNCYRYGFNPATDLHALIKLMQSDTLLVSLNAAKLIYQSPTATSVQALIDLFSEGRSLQRSLCLDVLLHEKTKDAKLLCACLTTRLLKEKNPYVRTFCYQLLTHYPAHQLPFDLIQKDCRENHLDLTLAALRYLASQPPTPQYRSLLLAYLHDKTWEIRAVVANLLGNLHEESLASYLEKQLHDPVWWVRINASQALSKLGKKGLAALKNQSREQDQFAYEAAQRVLITLGS